MVAGFLADDAEAYDEVYIAYNVFVNTLTAPSADFS